MHFQPCLVKLTDLIVSTDQQQLGLFRLFLTINYLELTLLNDQEIPSSSSSDIRPSSTDRHIANSLLVFLICTSLFFAYYHLHF